MDEDGTARFIYADAFGEFIGQAINAAPVRRASHVEPTADGRWTADMAPCGGLVLGPFDLRAEALAAESEWLAEWLLYQ